MLGAIIGSFLNVVIYRLPLKKSLSVPRSHCPRCKNTLGPLDLVPIFSYVFLRGKCRQCGVGIPLRYPGVELLTALLFIGTFYFYGLGLQTLIYLVFVALLVAIAFIDIDTMRIPNSLNLTLVALAGLQWALGFLGYMPSYLNLRGMLLGMALGGLVIGGIMLIGALFRVSSMGMGDLKLMLASGLLLGPLVTFAALMHAFVLGGFGAGIAILRYKKSLKSQIPFGPYLAAGLLLALWYGNWYLVI